MASILTSTAVFEEKTLGIGFTSRQLDLIKKEGVLTLGDVAFLVSLEAADANERVVQLAKKIFGDGVLMGDVGRLRHLITLSQALAAADMKRAIEDDTGCKMPRAERESRMAEARKRLGDVYTTGLFEPSLHLISALYTMKERAEWAHLPLSMCTSRRQELSGVKTDDHLKLVGGQLKVVKEDIPEAEI
eukprot:1848080-Amphidinium_carterae.1